MSENSKNKSVRVPVFDRQDKSFQKWCMRFRAYTRIAGFIKAIKVNLETDLPSNQAEVDMLKGSRDKAKKKKAATNRNNSAIASLILAFITDKLINIIMQLQTLDWPDGLASNVVNNCEKSINLIA